MFLDKIKILFPFFLLYYTFLSIGSSSSWTNLQLMAVKLQLLKLYGIAVLIPSMLLHKLFMFSSFITPILMSLTSVPIAKENTRISKTGKNNVHTTPLKCNRGENNKWTFKTAKKVPTPYFSSTDSNSSPSERWICSCWPNRSCSLWVSFWASWAPPRTN